MEKLFKRLPDSFSFMTIYDNNIIYTAERKSSGNFRINWFSPISNRNESLGYSEKEIIEAFKREHWVIINPEEDEISNIESIL